MDAKELNTKSCDTSLSKVLSLLSETAIIPHFSSLLSLTLSINEATKERKKAPGPKCTILGVNIDLLRTGRGSFVNSISIKDEFINCMYFLQDRKRGHEPVRRLHFLSNVAKIPTLPNRHSRLYVQRHDELVLNRTLWCRH